MSKLNIRILKALAKNVSASQDEPRIHLRTVHTMPHSGGTVYTASNGIMMVRAFDPQEGGPKAPFLIDAAALTKQANPNDETEVWREVEELSDSRYLIGDIASYTYPPSMYPDLAGILPPIVYGEPCAIQPRMLWSIHQAYYQAFGIQTKYQTPIAAEYVKTKNSAISSPNDDTPESACLFRKENFIAYAMPCRVERMALCEYEPWQREFSRDLASTEPKSDS